MFSLALLGPDGKPQETTDPGGAVVRIAVNPDGSTAWLPNAGGPPVAQVLVATPIVVADAP